MVVRVSGDIIKNDDKWIYDWFGMDSFCPEDLLKAIEALPKDEKLEIKINSGGGSVFAGKEIYSILRARTDVEIEIQSVAASAASLIAMAGHSAISPVGTVMIHSVSLYGASGNAADMEKYAEILHEEDETLANAYAEKSGLPREDIIKMMAEETWLSAERAVEMKLIDEITQPAAQMAAAYMGMQLTESMRQQAMEAIAKEEARKKEAEEITKDLYMYGV